MRETGLEPVTKTSRSRLKTTISLGCMYARRFSHIIGATPRKGCIVLIMKGFMISMVTLGFTVHVIMLFEQVILYLPFRIFIIREFIPHVRTSFSALLKLSWLVGILPL
jgi:hypothetical protein